MSEDITRRVRKGEPYPLRLSSDIEVALEDAKRKTGINNSAEILRLAVARGLPILVKQLNAPVGDPQS